MSVPKLLPVPQKIDVNKASLPFVSGHLKLGGETKMKLKQFCRMSKKISSE